MCGAQNALVAEARLLTQAVAYVIASTTPTETIEGRMTLEPLSARRLAEMVALGQACAAIELVVSAQAVEARGTPQLGRGTARAFAALRSRVPFVSRPEQFPADLEPVNELILSGVLSDPSYSVQPAGPGSGRAAGRSTRRQ